MNLAFLFVALQLLPASASPSQAELQGSWEGKGPSGNISVTISGNSLRFYARDDFWYEATFSLPPGSSPQQLEATITDSSPPKKDIGEIVFAIVMLENGTLSLAVDDGSNEAPESFTWASSRYDLIKVECEP